MDTRYKLNTHKKPILREKCPNTELFLVRFFPHLDKIWTRKNSVFGHFSRSAI